MKQIRVTTEYITLAALLKLSGAVMSGGEAKERIRLGEALVNGEPCAQRGKKLRPGDRVAFAGEEYEVAGCI